MTLKFLMECVTIKKARYEVLRIKDICSWYSGVEMGRFVVNRPLVVGKFFHLVTSWQYTWCNTRLPEMKLTGEINALYLPRRTLLSAYGLFI